MWIGFNSLLHEDTLSKHNICYLTAINASPTNKDIVYQTMIQSKKVALECGQKYVKVTYDLAIAKIALQIQRFHIVMAYFKAVGKCIDDCGLTTVMVNEELIANGSTHLGLRANFEKGSFGIKRTEKHFSKQSIDLTLEQTINADAANKLTGNHTIRSTIINHTMKQTGLDKLQDVTEDFKSSRITKSTEQLHRFIDGIKRNINPFDDNLDKEYLYNISTGEAVTEHIENFLFNVEEEGNKKREKFILNCITDPNKFEQAIPILKGHTFADMTNKKKITVARGEMELRVQRDLFEQLSYLLTPVPLSMCHLDGTICKTPKSALITLLEKYNQSEPPQNTNVIIYDGYFIRAKIIVIAFDRYIFPLIKDTEHKLRGMDQANFCIDGPDQVRKKDFSIELKNANFKEALIQFFIENWEEDYMAPYFNNKIIYVNADACFKYTVVDSKAIKTVEQALSCPAHKDADTKILFHICQIDFNANVTIRCSDTDVSVIMLANMGNISENIQIFMEVGGKNKRFINVTQLHKSLGTNLSLALPAFHAFTGYSFNPAFFRKGKKRPFSIMKNSEDFAECFMQLSKPSEKREDSFGKIEEFLCQMYGLMQLKNFNDARVAMFQKTYKFLDNDDTFRLPKKSIDGSALPPCKSELYEHFLRSCYIAQLWSHAHLKVPITDEPSNFGWVEIDNRYELKWFSRSQLSTSINQITIQHETDDDNEDMVVDTFNSDSESET
ncbi:hypothetical protein RN001_013157 [Aquatica leii]|uniref:Uncharacterized protein n=1 Tax=Aquatica leii TaxID=1421715 RepID=A0AAN7SC95_9COLE|nr:hypothetical protein RN001_013157 [Aquatica leii]